MAFSTLMIIIVAMLITGGLLGFFLRPSVNWLVKSIRRLYFRPKLLSEHKVNFSDNSLKRSPNITQTSDDKVEQ